MNNISDSNLPDRLLADIGGTNARFALASRGGVTINQTYPVQDYPHLLDALRAFMAAAGGGVTLRRAALAVAGPKLDDTIRPTNSSWVCDRAEIAQFLGMAREQVTILNDFSAIAWGLNSLQAEDVTVLQAGQRSAAHPMLVMGPGTGLGMAALVPQGNGWVAVAAEAGMVRYAPADAEEARIVAALAQQNNFVTAEQLISGAGLVALYHALGTQRADNPAVVLARARSGEAQAQETLQYFARMFGSFAAGAALHYLALGGVYLTGGVLQKLGADFAVAEFLQRFNTHPQVAHVLQRMPVMRIKADIPAFTGLQCLLGQEG